MTRRTVALIIAIMALLGAGLIPSLPAGASPARDVDPTKIDPHLLALPQSALPSGASVSHSDVSDNADADSSRTHELHSQLFEAWHRITGYRMDYQYTAQGTAVDAGYLASIFPTPADASAAMDNATNAQSIIAYLGHPLPDACTAGEVCKGFFGPNPDDGTKTALVAIYTRGPILIEAAAQVPNAAFTQLESVMEAQVYAVANAVDVQVKAILNPGPAATGAPTVTSTATPTNTPVPPTATATVKPIKHKKCKKGYKLVHGKCKKVKKHH